MTTETEKQANDQMAKWAAEAAPLVGKNPLATPCSCGKSMAMVLLPFFHCPCCHDTYRLHKLTQPARCSHCGFNVLMWMRKNNLPRVTPPFA